MFRKTFPPRYKLCSNQIQITIPYYLLNSRRIQELMRGAANPARWQRYDVLHRDGSALVWRCEWDLSLVSQAALVRQLSKSSWRNGQHGPAGFKTFSSFSSRKSNLLQPSWFGSCMEVLLHGPIQAPRVFKYGHGACED